MTTTQITDVKFYTLQPVHELAREERKNRIVTAALRICTLCDVTVDTSGGPGSIQFCLQCFLLLKNGCVKLERNTQYDKTVIEFTDKETI